MSTINLSILIDDRYRDRILEVVSILQANGMKVQHFMEQIGVITGSIDSTQVEGISNIEGVASVEFAQTYQLEPPESDIQ